MINTEIQSINIGTTQASALYVGTNLIWSASTPIPSQYVQVQYIESYGTSNSNMSYINTGWRCSNNTQFDFKMVFPANRVYYARYNGYCPFGSWTWTNASSHSGGDMSFTMIFWDYSRNLILGSGSSSYNVNRYVFSNASTPFNIADRTEHVIEGTLSTSAFNLMIDNTQYNLTPNGGPWSGLDGTSNTISEFYLFTTIWGEQTQNPIPPSTFITIRMYYFKIYDNNVLVRDYVPVYDTVAQKYGLYDKVNNTFNVSPNSVDFTGPQI